MIERQVCLVELSHLTRALGQACAALKVSSSGNGTTARWDTCCRFFVFRGTRHGLGRDGERLLGVGGVPWDRTGFDRFQPLKALPRRTREATGLSMEQAPAGED